MTNQSIQGHDEGMENTPTHLVSLLDERGVARFLNVSVAMVRHWRQLKAGPRFLRIGKCVRYSPADLETFLQTMPTGGATVIERPVGVP